MHTLGDLFSGHLTIGQVLADVAPVIIPALFAFYAGYWRGRVVEFRESVVRRKRSEQGMDA